MGELGLRHINHSEYEVSAERIGFDGEWPIGWACMYCIFSKIGEGMSKEKERLYWVGGGKHSLPLTTCPDG